VCDFQAIMGPRAAAEIFIRRGESVFMMDTFVLRLFLGCRHRHQSRPITLEKRANLSSLPRLWRSDSVLARTHGTSRCPRSTKVGRTYVIPRRRRHADNVHGGGPSIEIMHLKRNSGRSDLSMCFECASNRTSHVRNRRSTYVTFTFTYYRVNLALCSGNQSQQSACWRFPWC
jgi:hypothetical protein